MPITKNTHTSARIAVALTLILVVVDWSVLQKALSGGHGGDAALSYHILLLTILLVSMAWAWKRPKSLAALGLLVAGLVLNVLSLAHSTWNSAGVDPVFAPIILPSLLLFMVVALTGLAFAARAYYAATKEKTSEHFKYARQISWAALAIPFVFAILARIIQDGIYVTVPYTTMMPIGVKAGIVLPVTGIVLGSMAWKTKLGKIAVALNLLLLIHNGWWILSLPQQ